MHHFGRVGVLAIAAGALVLAGCGTTVRIDGVEVDGKVPFLSSLETAWADRQAGDPYSQRAEKTGCWLLRAPSTGALEPKALCGPIRHLKDRGKPGAFDEVSFTPSLVGEKDVEVSPDSIQLGETGVMVPEGLELYRPDGEKPISADKVPEPPSPKAEAGTVTQIDGDLSIESPIKPKDGMVVAPGLRVSAKEVGSLLSLPRDSDYPYFVPADGEEFLSVKVAITDLDYDQGEVSTEAAYSVESGGERTEVALKSPGDSKLTQESTLVVSVPKGSDAQLVVTVAGLDQSISLRTGERTSKTAEAMYRHFSEVSIGRKYSGSSTIGRLSIRNSVEFLKAKVAAFHRDRGWAPKGHVWVQLSWDNNAGEINPSHLYDVPTIDKVKTLQATDSNGEPCSVSGVLPVLDVTVVRGEVLISVPISSEEVNITYAPRGEFAPSGFGATIPDLSPRSGNFTMNPIKFAIRLS